MRGRQTLRSERVPRPAYPYAPAVLWESLVFVSGQLPDDLGQDVRGQTRQVLEKLKLILDEAGSSLGLALKVTCYLDDWADFAAMNEVYAEYFPSEPPARSTIQAVLVSPEHRIVMDIIAAKKPEWRVRRTTPD